MDAMDPKDVNHNEPSPSGAPCHNCECTDCGGFQKLLESKQGLTVYRDTSKTVNKTSTKSNDTSGGRNTGSDDNIVLTIHNTKDKDWKYVDFIKDFDINKVSCPRCRYVMDRARVLLEKVSTMEKNEIKSVCESCIKSIQWKSRLPCHHCQRAFEKFENLGLGKQKDDKLKKTFMSILADESSKVEIIGTGRKLKAYSDIDITKTLESKSHPRLDRPRTSSAADARICECDKKLASLFKKRSESKKVRIRFKIHDDPETVRSLQELEFKELYSANEVASSLRKSILKQTIESHFEPSPPAPPLVIPGPGRVKKSPYRSGVQSGTVLGIGTTGIRRVHSDESLITSFSGITEEMLMNNFKYVFPRMIKSENVREKTVSTTSAELIKDTQVRFQEEAIEKIRKQEELKIIKQEKKLKSLERGMVVKSKEGIGESTKYDTEKRKKMIGEREIDDEREEYDTEKRIKIKGKKGLEDKYEEYDTKKRKKTKEKKGLTDKREKYDTEKRKKIKGKEKIEEYDKQKKKKMKGKEGTEDKEYYTEKTKKMKGKKDKVDESEIEDKSKEYGFKEKKIKGKKGMEDKSDEYYSQKKKIKEKGVEDINKEYYSQKKNVKGIVDKTEEYDSKKKIKEGVGEKEKGDGISEKKGKENVYVKDIKKPSSEHEQRGVNKGEIIGSVQEERTIGEKEKIRTEKDVEATGEKITLSTQEEGTQTQRDAVHSSDRMVEFERSIEKKVKKSTTTQDLKQDIAKTKFSETTIVKIKLVNDVIAKHEKIKSDAKKIKQATTAKLSAQKKEAEMAAKGLLKKTESLEYLDLKAMKKNKEEVEKQKQEQKNKQTGPKSAKEVAIKDIKVVQSGDDLILHLVKTKREERPVAKLTPPPPPAIKVIKSHRQMQKIKSDLDIHSESESDEESVLNKKLFKSREHEREVVFGQKIYLRKDIPPQPDLTPKIQPALFQTECKEHVTYVKITDYQPEEIIRKPVEPGPFRYALSDQKYIENGWTILPTEKIVRKLPMWRLSDFAFPLSIWISRVRLNNWKPTLLALFDKYQPKCWNGRMDVNRSYGQHLKEMNVYRMEPAHPEFDWFKHNKDKGTMKYESGEKLAEINANGRGKWFYKNGRLALDYYDSAEMNVQQRFVIYGSGEPDERGRSQPTTILGMFDYMGNGVVFDNRGKIRLKYNQSEGVVLDRELGPVTHWLWHSLNEPPELQQVMIDTQLPFKDPSIFAIQAPDDKVPRQDDEKMLAIEFDNYMKSNAKSTTEFKPHQIRMKALKINDQFSLKVIDQESIYLLFREGSTTMKLNLGMKLNHNELVETGIAELNEVSLNLEIKPALSDSLECLQKELQNAQNINRVRTERELKMRPRSPAASADKMTAAASKPLRPPLRTTEPTSTLKTKCKTLPTANNLYYNTRLI